MKKAYSTEQKDIIFDLDDTLVYVKDYFNMKLVELYKILGFNYTVEEFAKDNLGMMTEINKTWGIDRQFFWDEFGKIDSPETWSAAIKKGRIRLFSDTLESLERLVKRANLYIVSNTPQTRAEVQVKELGIGGFFTAVSYHDGVKPDKPDPYRANEILPGKRIPGSELWTAGDSYQDVWLGKALNAYTIFLLTRKQKPCKHADYNVCNLREGTDVILKKR